jgi:hypothetical protein
MAGLSRYPALARWAGAWGLVLLSMRATAQTAPGWVLKLTPQHVVLSGLWLEAEQVRARHPRQTLTLGAQLYAGQAGRPDVPFNPDDKNLDRTVRGAGVFGQHRFYLGSQATADAARPLGFYLGYGSQVQVFRLGFKRSEWHEETGPNELPYLVFGPVPYHETVLRYGVAGQAGYQAALSRRVLVEVYAGLGLRKSHSWASTGESQFRSGPSDYAHQGLYFPAGFKVGVALR